MKKTGLTIIASFLLMLGFAQQEQHFTQFMFNKLAYNPAYAGSNQTPCFTGIVRSQWIGLEGAPKTQVLTFDMPLLNNRVGLGANLIRNTIGVTENITTDIAYSYRIRVGMGTLSGGIQTSVRYLKNDYNKVKATQPVNSDGSIPTGLQSKFVPNFGMGLYFNSENYYVGFSIPRLLQNNIDLADSDIVLSKEIRHFYLMAGFSFPVGDHVKIQPQALLKYVANTPFDADANISATFVDKFTLGVTYRLGGSSITGVGESLDVLIAAQITENLLFAASYDITLSDLKDYNSGSIEAALRYCLGGKAQGDEYINPRFF